MKNWIIGTVLVALLIYGVYYLLTIVENPLIRFGIYFVVCVQIIYQLSASLGKSKAYKTIQKELRKIKLTNPYIYFRELPNKYGIGITSILVDFNIEFKKDVVAAILDLAAKKYIKLINIDNKYQIQEINSNHSELTNNEKYLLTYVLKKAGYESTKKFDYHKWKKYCIQDAQKMGLIEKREIKESILNPTRVRNKIFGTIFIILLIIINIFAIIMTIEHGMTAVLISVAISVILSLIISLIIGKLLFIAYMAYFGIAKQSAEEGYNTVMIKTPKRTKFGEEELQKWLAFYKFLKDFGNFAPKHIDEIIIWEFYLSHAQLFNLTKQVMKTGYKQLLHNEAFEIQNYEQIDKYICEHINF